jgi:hypothetical protein
MTRKATAADKLARSLADAESDLEAALRRRDSLACAPRDNWAQEDTDFLIFHLERVVSNLRALVFPWVGLPERHWRGMR